MKILVVQESDWLERNPHQQHHLMERMAKRGHEIRVIDYPIDWPKDNEPGLIYKRQVYNDISKIINDSNIDVIRPSFVKIKGLNYATLFFTHKKEIERQIREFKPDIILGLGILNTYNASKIAKKHNIPFVYYFIDVLHALIPEKAFQNLGKWFTQKTIENATLVITINKKLSEFAIKMGSKPDSTILIDAGIDLESYDPDLDDSAIREEYGIAKDDIVLFFMGWIYEFAGMKELARATGKQPFEKIPGFLASADFCLLPAHIDEPIMQDIVPIKIYEYLAMKKVVIATELPGLSKEFGYGNGIEYIQDAIEVLKTAKDIVDNDKYDEIAANARKYVESNDWEAITDKFEQAMKNLL